MKLLTVAGPPSSGKTSVILHLARILRETGAMKIGVVKFDCLSSSDAEAYEKQGIPIQVGLSVNLCPDHFYISNIEDAVQWASAQGLDLLAAESAGLCNRCSPHIREVPALCVIDNLSGSRTPEKIGPMLKFADTVVITKGDIVSQAEREVFAHHVRKVNPRAGVVFVNGITGQGAMSLLRQLRFPEFDTLQERRLRFTMPSALCSYCTGQTRIGRGYQMGNVRKMEFGGTGNDG